MSGYYSLSQEVRAKSEIVPYDCVREWPPCLSPFSYYSSSFSMLNALSLRPACNLLAYTGYPDLYFCMSLERSMSCSWSSMCPPTDGPR